MTTAPRTQMSTVGFFDWSTDDPGDVAVTDIYRKIATTQKSKFNKSNRHWCTDGIHLNPGRMFVRDKADLTKGEREIIAGIYKNRSDVHGRNGVGTNVRSHKDAWLIGKQISKSPVDLDKYSVKITDRLLNKSDSKEDLTHPMCYLCANCKECYHNKTDTRRQKKLPQNAGRTAPPSTPSNSPPSTRKELKPIKDRSKEGAVFVESGKTFYDAEEGSKKKKVFVDVFLPKYPTQSLLEEKTCSEISVDRESKKTLKSRREKSTSKKSVKENSEHGSIDKWSPVQCMEDNGKQKLFSSRSSNRVESSVAD